MRSKWDSLRENEPFSSVERQLEILESRGLIVRDRSRASHALAVIGYHRLRDYYRPYYENPSAEKHNRKFIAGTSFNSILNLYYLDRELRFFLLGPLEKLEVSLRGNIIKSLGDFYSKNSAREFNLLAPEHFNLKSASNRDTYLHVSRQTLLAAKNLAFGNDQLDRKESDRVRALRQRLNSALRQKPKIGVVHLIGNEFAPWPVIHKLSFGPIALIYKILVPEVARPISENYQMRISVLRSSLDVLRNIRNSCAHHEPIWFRSTTNFNIPNLIQPAIWPDGHKLASSYLNKGEFRIYEVCAVIHYLLAQVSENTTWYKRLKPLIDRFDSDAQKFMGFPHDWTDLRYWRSPSP